MSTASWSGSLATAIALLLGTLAAFALQRNRFFGREAISLLIVLPIALPGIVTGIALSNVFTTILGIELSIWSLVIAHATFCIVVVFNNVVARLRRLGGNFEEASMDLGATRFTTFRLVTLPNLRSALFAGALLAFALSFDEIVVTTFTAPADIQTLPLWILHERPEPPAGADRERGRGRAGPAVRDPDLLRPAAVGRRGRRRRRSLGGA